MMNKVVESSITMILRVFVLVLSVVVSSGQQQLYSVHQPSQEMTQLSAVAGGRATLTCDVTSAAINDTLLLVVWYREDTPIYSYDTRGGSLTDGAHWADRNLLGGRASFRVASTLAILVVDDVLEKDAGEYQCRVDFKVAPTRYFRINLDVIVLPQKPKIFDERGKQVFTKAGPYYEGGDLRLTCMVSGGKPTPSVVWYRDDVLAESVDTASGFVQTRASQLRVRGLTRADQHARFTCKAVNTPLVAPLTAFVDVEMYLKPIEVEIMELHDPLSANRQAQISCRSVGARPPAKLSWWLHGVRLEDYQQTDSKDGNISTSTLNFNPVLKDNGKVLTCRAENIKVENSVTETTLNLNVQFMPLVNIQLGPKLNPNDIEEGDDVYFECNVRANPPAYKIIWEHNGQPISHNPRIGIIVNSGHLALQSVTRAAAGRYTCAASNVEGDGRSPPFTLNVMYKPVCSSGISRVYGVARNERVRVHCVVEAHPPPDTFAWTFNNTAHSFEFPKEKFITGEAAGGIGNSILTYTPNSEMDYGTLLCWASNFAGKSVGPCSFNLIPAGPPEMPMNCSVHNQTSESLEVDCMPGNDGGVQQTFNLEVWEQQSGDLQANISTRKVPLNFMVGGLGAGVWLKMKIYAFNDKGRSDVVEVEGFTLKMAEKQTGSHEALEMSSVYGILIGILITFIIVLAFALIIVKLRHRFTDFQEVQTLKQEKNTVTNTLTPDSAVSGSCDDKNPDVVPLNNKFTAERYPPKPPDPPPYCRAPAVREGPAREGDVAAVGINVGLPNEDTSIALSHTSRSLHNMQSVQLNNADVKFSELSLPRPRHRPSGVRCNGDGSEVCPQPTVLRSAPPREIVTTRTPLLASQQESCV